MKNERVRKSRQLCLKMRWALKCFATKQPTNYPTNLLIKKTDQPRSLLKHRASNLAINANQLTKQPSKLANRELNKKRTKQWINLLADQQRSQSGCIYLRTPDNLAGVRYLLYTAIRIFYRKNMNSIIRSNFQYDHQEPLRYIYGHIVTVQSFARCCLSDERDSLQFFHFDGIRAW